MTQMTQMAQMAQMARPMIFQIKYPENFMPSRPARDVNERNVTDRSFTFHERTVAKLTMKDIIAKAKAAMACAPMCMNAVDRFDRDDLFTIAAASELIQEIINDSRYYNQVY